MRSLTSAVTCFVRGVSHQITGRTSAVSRIPQIVSSQCIRNCSSSTEQYKYLNIKTEEQKGVVILEMKKKPVNSLNLEYLTEFNIALEKLENDKSCRGVILTSAFPVFCAGLDILELYQPQEERLRTFWHSFQNAFISLYGSSKACIAAINGPAPAGGCALSLACDYRIMAEGKNHVIGLNESLLGIVAPYWLQGVAKLTVGERQADLMLQLGALFPPEHALKIGLVDEVVPQDQLMNTALNQMQTWLAVPAAGRQLTKQVVRKDFIDEFNRLRQEDTESFVNLITKDAIQTLLGKYIEALKAKAAK